MGAKNEQLEPEKAGRAYERFRDGGKKTLRELPSTRHNNIAEGMTINAYDRATTPTGHGPVATATATATAM
jgi:hypothetical protein